MSYRSFKRVLGETHLERKCLFLFGACLLVLTAGSFWLYGTQTEKLVYQQNRQKARLLVDIIKMKVHWESLETRKEFNGPGAEVLKDWHVLIQELKQTFENEDYKWSTIRPNPIDGKGKPQSEYDYEVLKKALRSQPEPKEIEYYEHRAAGPTPEEEEYHYYQVVRAETNCVVCHRAVVGSPDIIEGDVLSVLKVSIPQGPVQSDIAWNDAILWTMAIITAFLLVVASYVIIRYVIVKPLKHLQDVSDAISRGDMEKRAEIHTGDEFEALGVAFNRMVRHLVAVQAELRHVNSDLDSKIDELAQRNMQLYETNRLKGDFLATVSHELRTPLNSIIGFSDVLGSIESLDNKQRRYVENIQKSGKMLLEMINDILDLAKIESGKMEIRASEFRIDQVIGAQCDMARPLTEKKNIDLEVDIEGGLPTLWQDQPKVQQILNNLLSNAIKFTPEGGRIEVAARRDASNNLSLVVSDTGVGIAEEDQTKIFEKFRQGESALPTGDAMTREYSGTGLGLSIVKELCKLLGGEILLASELGKGSAFTVRLPWRLPEQTESNSFLPRPLAPLSPPRRAEVAVAPKD